MNCKECTKAFECFISGVDPCKAMIEWKELTPAYRMPDKSYKSKGIGAAFVRIDGTRNNNSNPNGRRGK